jgi:hypothetical protein
MKQVKIFAGSVVTPHGAGANNPSVEHQVNEYLATLKHPQGLESITSVMYGYYLCLVVVTDDGY